MVPDDRLDALRRRSVWTIVAGVALASTGFIAAVTVGTIVAEDLAGSSALAGAPSAAAVFGTAIGAAVIGSVMARYGRRAGLTGGYAVGVVGAIVATAAVVGRSLPLLLAGTLLIGFGNSGSLLGRYAAADLAPTARRASTIGLVVWGATVGAVVGPNLVSVAGALAPAFGLPALAGPYLLPIVLVGLAALLSLALLRPDPSELAVTTARDRTDGTAPAVRALLAQPTVVVALIALIVGQAVMVLVMTMTPLHMTEHGHGLDAVGLVISAHTLGMFALSPISGRLADRFGAVPVILAGSAVLAGASTLAAVAPPEGGAILLVALFLLGFGWNLGFVAGSELLTRGLVYAERARLQGVADAIIWSGSAAASLGSGLVVAAAGYTALGMLGAAAVIVPVWVVITRRSILAPAPARADLR